MRQVAVALALLAAMLAGCADGGAPATESTTDPAAFEEVQVSSTTGAIRGVVYNEAIVPIADVLVQLAGGANKTTDDQGAFVFSNLEPGDYFITASKTGYFTVQQSTTVVAGEVAPPVTKIQLLVDVANQPFVELYQWTAFLQCGAWAIVVTTNPCAATGSDNVHPFPWGATGRIPDAFQAEAIWTGTQPLGNYLSFSAHEPGSVPPSSCYGVNSESPAILNKTKQDIIDCYGEEATEVQIKLFPGATPGTPPTPTVLANQQYDVYMQYFFGFVPRDGYSLAVDGPCISPEQCG